MVDWVFTLTFVGYLATYPSGRGTTFIFMFTLYALTAGGFYGNSLPQLYGGKLPGWILADSLARRGLQPLTPIGLVEMATQRELTIASLLRISVQ
jgi:hypothetical protein